MVERHLAKVNVASSNLVFRSIKSTSFKEVLFLVCRVWDEADINYKGGYRNKQRVVFSNDGLVFVTYDHYKTFMEIIGEEQ